MPADPSSRPGYKGTYEPGRSARLVAPAAERNAPHIAAALAQVLDGARGRLVEIGGGTGQHAAACAAALPGLTWIPTDPDPEHIASMREWAKEAEAGDIAEPILLDASGDWPAALALTHGLPLAAVFCANVIHITPWAVTEGLFSGAARALAPGAPLILYGPFLEDGETAESNSRFDETLRSRNSDWGLRDTRDLAALASGLGLTGPERVEMPSNNLLVIFRR